MEFVAFLFNHFAILERLRSINTVEQIKNVGGNVICYFNKNNTCGSQWMSMDSINMADHAILLIVIVFYDNGTQIVSKYPIIITEPHR